MLGKWRTQMCFSFFLLLGLFFPRPSRSLVVSPVFFSCLSPLLSPSPTATDSTVFYNNPFWANASLDAVLYHCDF